MQEPSPEAKERIDAFMKEYGELVAKHDVDFVTYPIYIPSKEGDWKMQIQTQPIDTKNQPKKSPFVV